MKKKIHSWAVAAAILLKDDDFMHYEEFAKEVIDTGLTTLGLKGGTPWQTLGVTLRTTTKKGRAVFVEQGDAPGVYGLSDPEFVRSLPDVQEATRRLRELSSD